MKPTAPKPQYPYRQGKCGPCDTAYTWPMKSGLRLSDARCPNCGRELTPTSHNYGGAWVNLESIHKGANT